MVAGVDPDSSKTTGKLTRLERRRQWCVAGMWLPLAWIAVGMPILYEISQFGLLKSQGLARRLVDLFIHVFSYGFLVSPVVALGSLLIWSATVSQMRKLISSGYDPLNFDSSFAPVCFGRVKIEYESPAVIVVRSTPVSWFLRAPLSKGLFTTVALVLFSSLSVPRTGNPWNDYGSLAVATAFVLVVAYAMTSVEWIALRLQDGNYEAAAGTHVFSLPLRGGWRRRFRPFGSIRVYSEVLASSRDRSRPLEACLSIVGDTGLRHSLRSFSKGDIGEFQADRIADILRERLLTLAATSGSLATPSDAVSHAHDRAGRGGDTGGRGAAARSGSPPP